MPRYAAVAPHLPVTALADRYRHPRDPVERTRWHLLWLVADGRRLPEAAALVGYSPDWARAVVRRYNAAGPAGIVDGRHANPGATPLLSPALREELRGALGGPAPDGGLWTCAKVAAWMGDRLGRPVAEARGWEALRALGWTLQHPRPRAAAADPEAQAAFKKGVSRPGSTPSAPPILPRR